MFDLTFNLDNIIILASGSYLSIRGIQEAFKYLKKKYFQTYLPLKQALQYRRIPEVYHYHLFNYAQKLINLDKPIKSKKYLKIILEANPDYHQANYLMGVALSAEKNYHTAKQYLERETANNPDHPLVYFFLSQACFKLNLFDEALQAVEKAIELNPYYYSSYFLAMDIFAKLHVDPEKEWHFFQHAEELKCLTRPVWVHMARLEEKFLPDDERQRRQEVYESLENNWLEANRLKEKTLKALATKNFYKAESFALEGLYLNPHDNQLYQLYDQILIAQRKFPNALEFYLQSSKRINFNPLEATLRLVDYYVFNKQYPIALEKMLNLSTKHPNAKFLHYPLGILYNWIGESTKALNHLKKAIYYDRDVRKLVLKNPELENLRKSEDFQQIIKS